MSKAGEERYVFETEWFDSQASLIRKYLFTFFPGDSTIEMVSSFAYPGSYHVISCVIVVLLIVFV